jgi:protein-glutamine gamma-glutamyltransferase
VSGRSQQRRRDLTGAALALVATLFALTSGQWLTGGLALLACLLPLFTRRRWDVGRAGQAVLALAGIAAGIAVIQAQPLPDLGSRMGPRWSLYWGGAGLITLMVAIPRLYVAAPWFGRRGSVAVAIIALISCGHRASGVLYPALALTCLLALLVALRHGDPWRPIWTRLPRRTWLLMGAVAALAGLITVGVAMALPPLHRLALTRLGHTIWSGRTGFSEHFELRQLSGLAQSNTVVLRLRGAATDHLRGMVYTGYSRGRWLPPRRSVYKQHEAQPAPDGRADALTEIITVSGDRQRYFVPLAAWRAHVPGATARLRSNDEGVVRPIPGEEAETLRFHAGRRDRHQVQPPGPAELQLPEDLGAALRPLAAAWSRGQRGDRARMEALARRLRRDFTYSLHTGRASSKLDPALAFLTKHRTGHCEYFASALALLGRASGVPTRVIGGYRVQEHNALGGYYIVRERNAHAWVEAWLPDPRRPGVKRWETMDPTPPAALAGQMPGQTPFWGSLGDLIAHAASRALAWITSWSPLQLILLLTGLVALMVSLVLLRRLLTRRRSSRRGSARAGDYDPPLPALLRLQRALARRGAARPQSEPLERFAARLQEEPTALEGRALDAAALISAYAALRYGGVGDEVALAAELDALARQI